MSCALSRSSALESIVWYQHHITPSWLVVNVQELPGLGEEPGILLSHDLKKRSFRKNHLGYPLEGKIRVKNLANNHCLWMNYLITEMIEEECLPRDIMEVFLQETQLELLNNLKLTHLAIEFDQMLYFYSDISPQELLDNLKGIFEKHQKKKDSNENRDKSNFDLKIRKKIKIDSHYTPSIIKKCRNCGFENPSTTKICFNCGYKMDF